ncbi:hypothetical protein HN51_054412 [Arachis hypogaea]|uniref:Universal stress protein A-like protein n=1 Tax=Arachis hypogaea TaxID=3818 RepID=A0A444XIC4_ARAHY|nr:universal stress protein A-like protein [Arachis ipaensis]XP_025679958.1 universal stress protein A-like protein [Arachis hypogaea]QHN76965.1 Universal stress protein A-like protein [Arachis hypogaea]RYQ89270.1 hypothetical protein Ahy_B09g096001 isoform A [Arachis hypogaea]
MEKKEQKIMVAVDQSEESMHALSWCLSNLISDTNKKKLLLLHVKPPPAICSFDTAGYVFSPEVIAAMEKYSMELANSVMDKAEAICRNLNAADITMERVIEMGDAKNVICSTVQKLDADTLVMGSHGYGFFKRTLLGSVSDHCAKHAKCPVIIVKQP